MGWKTCQREQDTVKGMEEKEKERRKKARKGSCKREEAGGDARPVWAGWVLRPGRNNLSPAPLATAGCES